MIYLKKVLSLRERTSIEVAINLCQDNSFKEVVLCLEKPTFGALIFGETIFTTDPKKLSTWDKMIKAKFKSNTKNYDELITSFKPSKEENIKRWYSAVDEQCQRLTKGIPLSLRCEISVWINRIALEYLSYCWRQEFLIGISRYFLMDIFSRDSWNETGRLDEWKIARRLLEDERLMACQKLRVARVFFFPNHIPRLLKNYEMELEQPFQNVFSSFSDPYFHVPEFNADKLVSKWLSCMNASQNMVEAQSEICLMLHVTLRAGYETMLMQFWKMLKECDRQEFVISMALESLRCWQYVENLDWREALILNEPHWNWPYNDEFISPSRLPSHYCELLRIFLLHMNEEQQLKYFQLALKTKAVLQCFLNWPLQDEFLPIIYRLWEIIPMHICVECLLMLACKYSGDYDTDSSGFYLEHNCVKENSYYDYRSLLWRLWEDTPQSYKQYMFSYTNPKRNHVLNEDKILSPLLLRKSPFEGTDDELFKIIWRELWEETPGIYMWNTPYFPVVSSDTSSKNLNEGMVLLLRLLKRSPFRKKDLELFKRIWFDVPQEQKTEIMYFKTGQYIFSILMTNENWSLLNWLLEECLPKDKIFSCKKEFLQSKRGRELCLNELVENRAKLFEDFINWTFETDEEKTQFRYKLISEDDGLLICMILLSKGKFCEVERIMNICLSFNEIKNLDANEKAIEFKSTLFSCKGVDIHNKLVFYERQWDDVIDFYKWFCLSPKEIARLKRKTIFLPRNIRYVQELLDVDKYAVLPPLFWCLTDGEMMLELMNEIEKGYSKTLIFIKKREVEELLKFLMKELLENLSKESEKSESTDWL